MEKIIDTAPPSRPPHNDNPVLIGGANVDQSMVIILAALLCALICALGINSIVRCAVRCTQRLADEERAVGQLASVGMKKSALRRMPVSVYGADGVRVKETECPICLAEFVDGEKVRVLPKCGHGFHVGCIDTWLASRSSCPTCRRSLVDCGRRPETLVG